MHQSKTNTNAWFQTKESNCLKHQDQISLCMCVSCAYACIYVENCLSMSVLTKRDSNMCVCIQPCLHFSPNHISLKPFPYRINSSRCWNNEALIETNATGYSASSNNPSVNNYFQSTLAQSDFFFNASTYTIYQCCRKRLRSTDDTDTASPKYYTETAFLQQYLECIHVFSL